MNSRERVINALNFKDMDKLPKDLGGMASTGISAFAYPKLVNALGLPPRRPRVHDTGQMLALPDMDVLDALGCDVVTIFLGVTNAFEEPNKWEKYDFNGRLPALVRDKNMFRDNSDGSIFQMPLNSVMLSSSTVFNEEHAGQLLNLSDKLPMPDLELVKKQQEESLPTDKQIEDTVELCKRVRNSTDKAIFFNGPFCAGISITSPGGIAIFPMLCLTEPNYVRDLHGLATEYAIKRINLMLPAVAPYIEIIMMGSDDWGTQNSLIAPPRVFESLFLPYYKKINTRARQIAPNVKRFLHSCGAIYDVIDFIIDAGFDILNPIQWPAGGHSYEEWKDKCRKRIVMWGGGVNTQGTLPLGSIDDVRNEVKAVTAYLRQGNGYVFNGIHNLLAETDPEKIITMYGSVE